MFAGASQGGLIAFAATEAGIDRRRLIGSSPEALVSSVVAVTALEAGCSPREVMLTVLGAPPASFVVPWSEGTIGGYPLPAVLSQVALARLEARVGICGHLDHTSLVRQPHESRRRWSPRRASRSAF